jgi:hypothetical protein
MINVAWYSRARITEAIATTHNVIIRGIWNEIAYSWGFFHVTRGHHTEHLCISVDKNLNIHCILLYRVIKKSLCT